VLCVTYEVMLKKEYQESVLCQARVKTTERAEVQRIANKCSFHLKCVLRPTSDRLSLLLTSESEGGGGCLEESEFLRAADIS
jgi:hypothetical protein